MKKIVNAKTVLSQLIFILLIIFLFNSISTAQKKKLLNLSFKKIIEEEYYKDSNNNDTLFKIISGPNGVFRDYYLLNPNSISMVYGQFPSILLSYNNKFVLNNNFQGIRIFDLSGKCIYKLDYDRKFFLNYKECKIDEYDNIYLILKNQDDTNDIKGYKINIELNAEVSLTNNEILNLNLLQNTRSLSTDIDLGVNKNNLFSIKPEGGDFSLYDNSNGRFLPVNSLIIYKESEEIAKINISDFNEKIIFVKYYYMDENLNIYIIGFKSNESEIIELHKAIELQSKRIKVLNPIFFIWKFENNG
ncbi:MAG: hypothetical protein IPM38_08960 [Ignavibacteria bacterium]|nr:hypothetical protein [Ignavibacteria bacterium]